MDVTRQTVLIGIPRRKIYRPEFFSGLLFTATQVVFITAKIAFIFTSLTAVQIYDFHIFTTVYSPLHGFIWNQHSDQLPVGLLAQLVEHCTGIAEVMGSNPVQAWIFFRPSFHYYLSSVHYCEDRFHIQSGLCLNAEFNLEIDLSRLHNYSYIYLNKVYRKWKHVVCCHVGI